MNLIDDIGTDFEVWQATVSESAEYKCVDACLSPTVPFLYERVFSSPSQSTSRCSSKLSWHGAMKFCRSYKMELPSLMSASEKQRDIVAVSENAAVSSIKSSSLWTSGSNLASGAKRLFWAETGTDVTLKLPSNASRNSCLKLSKSDKGVTSRWLDDCRNKYPVLCEVPPSCFSSRCVSEDKSQSEIKIPNRFLKYASALCEIAFCPQRKVPRTKKIEDANSHFEGTTLTEIKAKCGSKYFLTDAKETYKTASKYCCDQNMKLLSLESEQKVSCFAGYVQARPMLGDSFWTSGMLVGSTALAWCSNGQVLAKTAVRGTNQSASSEGHECVVLGVTSAVGVTGPDADRTGQSELGGVPCNTKARVVCEHFSGAFTTQSSGVLPQDSCKPSNCVENLGSTLFKKGMDKAAVSFIMNILGTAAKASSYQSSKTCGGEFFFVNKNETFATAKSNCAETAYSLLTVDSEAKMNCVEKFLRDQLMTSDTFWVDSTYNECSKQFWWCSRNVALDVNLELNQISASQMDLNNCGIIKPDASGFGKSNIQAANCLEKRRYICENELTIIGKAPKLENCTHPQCPDMKCFKNELVFAGNGTINVPSQFSLLNSACEKQYIVSTYQAVFSRAVEKCCSHGLKLMTMGTEEDRKCPGRLIKYNQLPGSMWVFATDLGCEGRWEWCGGSNVTVADDLWMDNQPDNFRRDENCAVLLSKTMKLNDIHCEEKRYFLCQGI